MIAKRLTCALGAFATLLAPTGLSAAIPGKIPDHVDDMACFVFLDYYIFSTEKRLDKGMIDEKDRASVIGYVKHWRDARGYYEGRLSLQLPDQLAKNGQAAIKRIETAVKDEVSGITIDCLRYYDARHKDVIGPIYGPAADDK